jgi:hypothetical protein
MPTIQWEEIKDNDEQKRKGTALIEQITPQKLWHSSV